MVALADRAVIALAGPDARDFLQGLVSNDVRRLAPGRALYAALLTPQGKYLFDFILYEQDGEILLEVEAARAGELLQKLLMYRLRARVTVADRSDALAVATLLGPEVAARLGLPPERGAARPWRGGVVAIDPRLALLGARAVLPRDALPGEAEWPRLPADAYERLRLSLGVPASSRDLVAQRSTLLESGFEELGGVSFDKGCFVGQELTARTKHRGLVRKRLLPVRIEGPCPAPGTPLLRDGHEAGEMRSSLGDRGMALVRLELAGAPGGLPELEAGDSRIVPEWPPWLAPPAAAG